MAAACTPESSESDESPMGVTWVVKIEVFQVFRDWLVSFGTVFLWLGVCGFVAWNG